MAKLSQLDQAIAAVDQQIEQLKVSRDILVALKNKKPPRPRVVKPVSEKTA